MIITLQYRDEHSDRVAEREFDWHKGMGSKFPVANPTDSNDTLSLVVLDTMKKHERFVCEVVVVPLEVAFNDILKYGFKEVTH